MTRDEMIEKIEVEIDEVIEGALLKTEDLMRRLGGTQAEIDAMVEMKRAEFQEWRAKTLVDLGAFVDRDGATLQ